MAQSGKSSRGAAKKALRMDEFEIGKPVGQCFGTWRRITCSEEYFCGSFGKNSSLLLLLVILSFALGLSLSGCTQELQRGGPAVQDSLKVKLGPNSKAVDTDGDGLGFNLAVS